MKVSTVFEMHRRVKINVVECVKDFAFGTTVVSRTATRDVSVIRRFKVIGIRVLNTSVSETGLRINVLVRRDQVQSVGKDFNVLIGINLRLSIHPRLCS